MSPLSLSSSNATGLGDQAEHNLRALTEQDQLAAIRRSVGSSLPINVFLGLTCLLVAGFHGLHVTGAVWFIASTTINVIRMMVCRWPIPSLPPSAETNGANGGNGPSAATSIVRRRDSVRGQLHIHALAAFVSGLVWATVPVLCAGYSNAQTVFFLSVVCGITAGAVTHSTAYAKIPICFITPALLSAAACLFHTGGFDRICLCAAVLLYLAALIRASRESESNFRQASRSKNEATVLANSLEQMNIHALHVSEQMRHLAWHDGLTGLFNRAGFIKAVEERLQNSSAMFSFMLMDLDGFKAVNDVFGHRTGDQVLAEIARRLRQSLPNTDLIGRLGGDEFAILHDQGSSTESAQQVATRLIEQTGLPIFDAIMLGASIGIHDACDVAFADRLAYADEALYVAKSAGRNQFRSFDAALLARLEIRRDIERDLPLALQDENLQVWFQPIFGEGGRRIESLEALLRWRHPVHGWINPPDLIFTAAVTGLSERLLRYILSRVCSVIGTLIKGDYPQLRVAMNMSPREIAQIRIEDIVPEVLAEWHVPPSLLEIEITEETAMDANIVQDRLSRLAALGVHIAIDDFGVGFSSLASLRHRDVRRVKIDRSFVSGLTEIADNQVLVDAVLQLGRSLDVEIVAEGVESEADLLTLRSLGCQTMQGYYLGRPMPSDILLDWIASQHIALSR